MDPDLASQLTRLTQAQRSYVLGILGSSLLRDWHLGGEDQADKLTDLFAAVHAFKGREVDDQLPFEVSVRAGYSEWAPTYDEPNAMILAEESLVRSMLTRSLQPGSVVLDAACGTGRHAAWLAADGHRTIGVDLTAAMLKSAAVAAPGVSFVQGDLEALPLTSGSLDAAVCALALCHFADLAPALLELARVLRPSGRLVISDPHGRAAYAGGQGFFGVGGVARPRFIRNYYRQASEWIQAFNNSGFAIESCHEPRMNAASAGAHPVARYFPDSTLAALRDVPYLWIWSVTRRDV
jgi:ubiquinone/menaquinone biosynthesis C-methylase UbiE